MTTEREHIIQIADKLLTLLGIPGDRGNIVSVDVHIASGMLPEVTVVQYVKIPDSQDTDLFKTECTYFQLTDIKTRKSHAE